MNIIQQPLQSATHPFAEFGLYRPATLLLGDEDLAMTNNQPAESRSIKAQQTPPCANPSLSLVWNPCQWLDLSTPSSTKDQCLGWSSLGPFSSGNWTGTNPASKRARRLLETSVATVPKEERKEGPPNENMLK